MEALFLEGGMMFVRSLPLMGLVAVVLVGSIIFNSGTEMVAVVGSELEPEVEVQNTIAEQAVRIAELEELVSQLSAEVADLREENRWDTVVFLNDPDGLIDNKFLLISEYRNREGEDNFYEVNTSRMEFQSVSTGRVYEIDALIGELVVIHAPLDGDEVLSYDACFNGFECRAMQEQARVVDD